MQTPLLLRFPDLVPARLVRRRQRFLADVRLEDGRLVEAHCPNSGSMLGCDRPGSRVYLSRARTPGRRTAFTWEMVRVGRVWVGIHTLRANEVVAAALARRLLPGLRRYRRLRREAAWSDGTRFDFLLEGSGPPCFVEVKNVTLRVGSVGAFPDAVTLRGQRHLEELLRVRRRRGLEAALVFVLHRSDVSALRPADEIDPAYGRLLRRAVAQGLRVLVVRTRVSPRGTAFLGMGRLLL
jgi:sugar fermentation stimulation protein A